ncbi:MAG TPA: DUF4160 domain-containing protein [Oligoflexia bacterium]|nr:DUF4160 domain-containing protein [Oligoflexia bacterium]
MTYTYKVIYNMTMGEMFRFGGIIIRVWSNDHDPPHVEAFWPSMKRPEAHAKFALDTLECIACDGFSARDVRQIQEELRKRHEKLWEGWRQIHGQEED